jgi:hypothetical protein
MKSVFLALALGMALTFSVTGSAADQTQTTVGDAPVQYEAAKGQVYPVVAMKDGKYYQVVKLPNSAPFFRVSANEWHYVDGNEDRDTLTDSNGSAAYPAFYIKATNMAPIIMPKGHSDADKETLLAGHGEYQDSLVCWGRSYGWYRSSYYYYPSYSYYPTYYYTPTYYYQPYYGYGYGYYQPYYYGYGVPTLYSGYSYVMNSWW